MKLNRKFIKALALTCMISIPGALMAQTMPVQDFIISCLLPTGTIICPELPETELPEITPPDLIPPIEKPDVVPPTELPDTDAPNMSIENQVLQLVNKERTSRGLNPLQMDNKVQQVARLKSQDMYKNNYFSHVSPTYGSPFDMLKSFGVSYQMAAENIAQGYPTAAAVVDGWMNSQGHRENILNPNFTHIGIGYEPNGHYWTQMFIK